MDLQQLLAAILNPNGMQQAQQPLGPPTAVGDHANPALLRQAQQRLAQPPQMAPQAQPMPQNAPQAAPAPAGGFGDAIGGILQNVIAPQGAQRNQTVQWLQQQGMDPGTATLMAGNKQALQQYLLRRSQGVDPLDRQYKEAQIANIQSQIDERTNPSVRDQFGLNPIYGKDADGNLVVMQPNKAGGLTRAELPEGVTLQPGTGRIDLGTAWGITDRAGELISTIPKDLAGAEAQKASGGKQGDAAFDLPRVEQNAEQTLGILERMKTHPGRAGSTGFIQGALPSRTSNQVDFQSLVDQTQGQSFLQAFQMLKGGGQITEIEGQKATDAISRLRNQRLSDADYLRAITDLENVVRAGLARAREQAGRTGVDVGAPGAVTPAGQRVLKQMSDPQPMGGVAKGNRTSSGVEWSIEE